MPVTISDYFRAVVDQIKGEIDATPDDRVLGMQLDDWVDYLVAKNRMEPIELDTNRQGVEVVDVRCRSGTGDALDRYFRFSTTRYRCPKPRMFD